MPTKFDFFLFLSIFLPIALVVGSAPADIIVSLIGLLYIALCIYKKNYKLILNKYSIFFFFYCFYLIVLSIFSKNIFLSLESSLFYFRFGVLVLAILYISNKYKFFNEIFYSILQITLLIVSIDLLLEVANIKYRISYIFFNDLKIGNISDRFSGLFGEEKKI